MGARQPQPLSEAICGCFIDEDSKTKAVSLTVALSTVTRSVTKIIYNITIKRNNPFVIKVY